MPIRLLAADRVTVRRAGTTPLDENKHDRSRPEPGWADYPPRYGDCQQGDPSATKSVIGRDTAEAALARVELVILRAISFDVS